MRSKIAAALRTELEPAALLWSDEIPDNARTFQKGKWGCVMAMFALAVKGATTAFDRETFGCFGGGVGLGFGNRYETDWQGGLDAFCGFLSSGNIGAEEMEFESGTRKRFIQNYIEGEGYVKSPELVKKFLAQLPFKDIPARYVIFKPLAEVKENQEPQVVIFTVNPHQLSALVVLANYARETIDNVICPFGAGCQTIGIFVYKEAEAANPRAVIGLTDISARLYVRRVLGEEVLTFAMPFKMFKEMENNVAGSFLERESWNRLMRL